MIRYYTEQVKIEQWLHKKEDEDRFIIMNEECCESDLEYMVDKGWLDKTYLTEAKDEDEMNKAVSLYRERLAPIAYADIIADAMNDDSYRHKKVDVDIISTEGQGYMAYYEVAFS